ncbi:MAG: ATPase, T2SS/T4P/T4SS family [Candidatus Micrarchaeia archaeon]|jgi:type IV secretory pathway ATPase VirB11/archaellum biosynthesis ATPase
MPEDYVVKQEGEKRRLVINYKGRPYGPDIAQYPQAFQDVIEKLQAVEADEVVLSEYYERIYNEEQTRLLRGIADTITKFETENIWSPSHLGKTTDQKKIAERHDKVLHILNRCRGDPFGAYMDLLTEIKTAIAYANTVSADPAALEDAKTYLGTLAFMRNLLEGTELIKRARDYLAQLGRMPEGRGIYMSIFEVSIKPSFIGSRIFFAGTETLQLVDQYEVLNSKVYIYKHPDKVEYLYYINPPEYSLPPEKYFLLEKTKEVVAAHRPSAVGFMDMEQARKYFRKIYVATIADLAAKNNINLSVEEKEDLATIVARYTIGYGILELILSDRKLTDVYIDSPLGVKPVYVVHSKYGQCQTNIIFSDEEARAVVSRFRALSGRPFDEAHPILDFDLPDLQTRICTIGKPLAVDGTAFALRLHKDTPWTLCQFIDNKMFPALAGGMFSFFVDAQASMLIVGSRGAGKTSFLQAMMQEIPQNLRIIVQEDSVTADARMLVERKGRIEGTTAGKLIDSLMHEYGYEEIHGKHVLRANPEGVRVFSYNPSTSKIESSLVTQFTRHKVTKPIYEVETRSGKKIKVTADHSLFTLGPHGVLWPIQTNLLKKGSKIAVANVSQIKQEIIATTTQTLTKTVLEARAEWDEVKNVKRLQNSNCFVYDFSVPGNENFVAEDIIAHNTQELPVPALKKLGFNIQRLKTRPPLGGVSEAEVSAEDALRTALRLGDSVLIVGEVRSGEAKALYEAMRVGAVGNVVMGTIHGESAYSIWDRVVNDLGVPTTSFKATDMCLIAAPIRFKGSLKRERRVIEVTEVGKEWSEEPQKEGGFLNWMRFDANKDELELLKDNLAQSEWIKRVQRNRGLSFEEIWAEMVGRGAYKQYLVDQKRKYDIPRLLEAENTVRAHNKYLLMQEKQREEIGKVDHAALLKDWSAWVDNELVRPLVALKK